MCHQYEISALVSQTSFGRETSGSVAKRRLFSQASILVAIVVVEWLLLSVFLRVKEKCKMCELSVRTRKSVQW